MFEEQVGPETSGGTCQPKISRDLFHLRAELCHGSAKMAASPGTEPLQFPPQPAGFWGWFSSLPHRTITGVIMNPPASSCSKGKTCFAFCTTKPPEEDPFFPPFGSSCGFFGFLERYLLFFLKIFKLLSKIKLSPRISIFNQQVSSNYMGIK